MGNRLITLEELKDYLGQNKYNPDGSLEYEVIRFYTKEVIDGKTHIVVYDEPVQIKLEDGKWHDLVDVLDQEALEFLDPTPYDKNQLTHVIIDSSESERFSPRRRELSPINKEDSFSTKVPGYLADHVWIDGASDTPGTIVLPYDFYDVVSIITDPNEDGEVKVIPVSEYEEGMTRPYYKKENGKTYIYVNHFSGGAGTQLEPYIVSTEQDLQLIYQYPNAWFVQDRDITIGGYQTGRGFVQTLANPNSYSFTGYYDGRNFAIRDLYINETLNAPTGLFPRTGAQARIMRVRLINVNVKHSLRNGTSAHTKATGALIGTVIAAEQAIDDCIVESGVVDGECFVGGLLGSCNGNYTIYIAKCQTHCEVRGSINYIGGFAGYIYNGGGVYYCLSTGKVVDSTIAQTASLIGAFYGSVGTNSSLTSICDVDTAGRANTAGAVNQYQTVDLKKQSTYTEHGWNFDWDFDMSDPRLNGGYPINRKWKKYQYGRGIPQDPFLIRTPDEFSQIRHYMYAHFKLETDIDLGELSISAEGFLPIGEFTPNHNGRRFGTDYMNVQGGDEIFFYGSIDGNGYSVGNFKINRPSSYTSLFKYIYGGSIKNLTIANATVISQGSHSAIFAGVIGNSRVYGNESHSGICMFNNIRIHSSTLETTASYGAAFVGHANGLDAENILIEDCVIKVSGSYAAIFASYWKLNITIGRTTIRRCEIQCPSYYSGLLGFGDWSTGYSDIRGHRYNYVMQLYDIYLDILFPATGGNSSWFIYNNVAYQKNGSSRGYRGMKDIHMSNIISVSRRRNNGGIASVVDWDMRNNANSAAFYTYSNVYYDRNKANNAGIVGGAIQPKYTTELTNELFYESIALTEYPFDFEAVWTIEESRNDGYPQLILHIPPKLPSLGFRNAFGNYFTDESGNILRYLEFGTSVAGTTSKVMPIWVQNNSEFSINNLQVWIDESTVKSGIDVDLSFTENPFVAEDRLTFPGTVGVGGSQKLYIRYKSDVTVKEGGTFDLRAKASPTF